MITNSSDTNPVETPLSSPPPATDATPDNLESAPGPNASSCHSSMWRSIMFSVIFGAIAGCILYFPVNALLSAYQGDVQLPDTVVSSTTIPESPDEKAFDVILAAAITIKEHFYRKIDTYTLFHGALTEVDLLLEHKGISGDFAQSLKKTGNEEEIMADFAVLFRQATQRASKRLTLDQLTGAAMNGLANATKDTYTVAMTSNEYSELQKRLNDTEFAGIGIVIEIDRDNHNQLTVIEPIPSSPAEKAGILPGDCILKIDARSTTGMDIETAASCIRGLPSTKVHLDLQRNGEKFDTTVTRQELHVSTVQTKTLPNNIGYIRISTFGPETGHDFTNAVSDLRKKGVKSFVVDVRNNGGGYVMAAIQVVANFLPKDSVVTTLINPRVELCDEYKVETSKANDLPVVVLANRFSASASEIVVGALQDNKRAKIVGEQTYGKGSVQNLVELTDGWTLRLTIAHYMTPNNKDINHKGISPDIECVATPSMRVGDAQDIQMTRALQVLKTEMAAK